MKKFVRILVTSSILVVLPFIISAQICLRHPNDGNAPNTGGQHNNPVGAPIGDGVGIILTLAFAYGAKKVYEKRKELSTKI